MGKILLHIAGGPSHKRLFSATSYIKLASISFHFVELDSERRVECVSGENRACVSDED